MCVTLLLIVVYLWCCTRNVFRFFFLHVLMFVILSLHVFMFFVFVFFGPPADVMVRHWKAPVIASRGLAVFVSAVFVFDRMAFCIRGNLEMVHVFFCPFFGPPADVMVRHWKASVITSRGLAVFVFDRMAFCIRDNLEMRRTEPDSADVVRRWMELIKLLL